MQKIIKSIINTIECNGFEAYIVGGYVRDKLLHIKTNDIDICTNARPRDLVGIFNSLKGMENGYGSYRIITEKLTFDITTYRSESNYVNHKPLNIKYINNLIDDIKRRDFTINALCMNGKGQIFDFASGKQDIKSKVIRTIGDSVVRIKEDPLRILRAIRLAARLNFTIDQELDKAISDNYLLVKELSKTRIKEEIDRILSSPNVIKGLSLLKKYHILEVLELDIDINNLKYINDLCGMYAQFKYINPDYFTKIEKNSINDIKRLLTHDKITNFDLYQYGLYPCFIVAKLNGLNSKKVVKRYEKLPLKSSKDLAINGDNICEILNIKPSKDLKIIINRLIKEILNNNLINSKDELENYLLFYREELLND